MEPCQRCKNNAFISEIYVRCVNNIEDFFEYQYKNLEKEEIKKEVMGYIDSITKEIKI